jgi:hypothetical protein
VASSAPRAASASVAVIHCMVWLITSSNAIG